MNKLDKIYLWTLILAIIILIFVSDIKAQHPLTGSGTELDPYLIQSVADWDAIRNQTNYPFDGNLWFELMTDLDFSGEGTYDVIDGAGAEYWRNHLDGNHHTISGAIFDSNVEIVGSGNLNRGLFYGLGFPSSISSANDTLIPVVKNLILEDFVMADTIISPGLLGQAYIGALSARAAFARKTRWDAGWTPTDDIVAAPIVDSIVVRRTNWDGFTVDRLDRSSVGGVIGFANEGRFSRLAVYDTLKFNSIRGTGASGSTHCSWGGIIGGVTWAFSLEKSFFKGDIKGIEGTVYDHLMVGGLIGGMSYQDSIKDSYFDGSITITSSGTSVAYIGGLVGYIWSLAGQGNSAFFYGCYSNATINESSNDISGLIYGYTPYCPGAFNVFADSSGKPITVPAGQAFNTATVFQGGTYGTPAWGQTEAMIPKTTAWMQTQSNYELESPSANGYPYDFTDIWMIGTSEYPTHQWSISGSTMSIVFPINGSYLSSPFNILWSGTGVYDTAIVVTNLGIDTVYGDTSYTIASTPNGTFPIKVILRDEPTVNDSLSIFIVNDGTISLDSAWATKDSLYYLVTTNAVDNLQYRVGLDTISMFDLGELATASTGIEVEIYVKPKPAGFFALVTDTVYFKVESTNDTSQAFITPTLNFIGQIGGNLVCWNPQVVLPIETTGILDLGCGWVNNMTFRYTTAFMNIPVNGKPYLSKTYNDCTPSCRQSGTPTLCGCLWAHYTFQAQDTVAGDPVETLNFADQAGYNYTGASSIVVYGRRYYFYGDYLYMDDLTNGIDSIFVLDTGDESRMINKRLWYFPYSTDIVGTLNYDGSVTSYLPERDTTLIVIHDNSDFTRAWSFNALPVPTSNTRTSDVYAVSGEAAVIPDIRNYFRGIHPKILKNGVL